MAQAAAYTTAYLNALQHNEQPYASLRDEADPLSSRGRLIS